MTESVNNITPSDVTAHPEKEKTVVEAKASSKIKREDLTQEKLKEIVELREDGFFYYVVDTRTHLKEDFAGTIRAHDLYYSLTLFGVMYSGKMLAHFYTTGEWVNATRGPRLDAEGNPIAAAPKKIKEERAPRKPPVFSAEDIEKAKAEAAAKREAAKLKAEQAEKKPEGDGVIPSEEPKPDTANGADQPPAEAQAEANPDF